MEELAKSLGSFDYETIPWSQLKEKWTDYRNQFLYYAKTFSRANKAKEKDIFLAIAGRKVQRIYEDVIQPLEDEETELEFVLQKLDEYFIPKQHEVFERNSFWSLKPFDGETLDKFMYRARAKANKCQFGTTESESREYAVMDKIIMMAPPDLKKRILEKSDLDFDMLMKLLNSHYSVQHQVTQLNASQSVGPNLSMREFSAPTTVNYVAKSKSTGFRSRFEQKSKSQEKCSRCGYNKHDKFSSCPAADQNCGYCDAKGHFKKMCYKRKRDEMDAGSNRPGNHSKRARVDSVQELFIDDDECQVLECQFVYALSETHEEPRWFHIGGVVIELTIDSGKGKENKRKVN